MADEKPPVPKPKSSPTAPNARKGELSPKSASATKSTPAKAATPKAKPAPKPKAPAASKAKPAPKPKASAASKAKPASKPKAKVGPKSKPVGESDTEKFSDSFFEDGGSAFAGDSQWAQKHEITDQEEWNRELENFLKSGQELNLQIVRTTGYTIRDADPGDKSESYDNNPLMNLSETVSLYELGLEFQAPKAAPTATAKSQPVVKGKSQPTAKAKSQPASGSKT